MYVYLSVTSDKYELPVAIGDSPKELGAILGVTNNAISSAIGHNKTGLIRGTKYIKVWIDDYDENEGVEEDVDVICND